jgi:hypothetical protein
MSAATRGPLGLGLTVDGVDVESGPYRVVVHRLIGGVFTADADAVRRLMPSARLHPLRFMPGRTLVMVNSTDADWCIGALPPFRCANLLIAAVATPGDRPGPWLTPIVTDGSAIRHRAGLVVLASVSTSRVLAEANRVLLGWPGFVGDICDSQGLGLEQSTVTAQDGLVAHLSVRPTGKPEQWHPTYWAYGVRGDQVLGWRMDMAATTTQLRWGPGAARLALGSHPALRHVRGLGLNPRGVIGSFHTDGTRVIDQPAFCVGPALAPPPVPAQPGNPEGRFVVATGNGAGLVVDAGHSRLGINPTGDFAAWDGAGLVHPVEGRVRDDR